MASDTDHAAVRFPPPVIGILTIVVGYLLGQVAPIADDVLLPSPHRYWFGGALAILGGLVLGAWPIRLFQKIEQDIKPWTSTPELVVAGPYRYSRNPMYLMMLIVCIAFSIILDEAWVLVLTPVCAVAIYLMAIRHEETYLEEKFGESYLAYKDSVRRWI
jgi:protein-S-isoprenylcysteine O-methyltransferase Ste14